MQAGNQARKGVRPVLPRRAPAGMIAQAKVLLAALLLLALYLLAR